MSWTPIDNEKREKSAIGRFEIIAERYIFGNERDRNIIKNAVGDKLYEDLHKA